MNADVNLTWNDVFFLTLSNENQQTEGGPRKFSSSYFRINASDSSSSSPGGGNNNNNSKNSNSGLSPAAKIGIGVGVGVGVPLLLLAGAAVFYLRRRRSKTTAAQIKQQGVEDSTGAGGYSNILPPISEVSGDAAYKAELPDESTTPCRAELPDGSTTPSKQTEPSEVDPTNVGVGVQSRFIELP